MINVSFSTRLRKYGDETVFKPEAPLTHSDLVRLVKQIETEWWAEHEWYFRKFGAMPHPVLMGAV